MSSTDRLLQQIRRKQLLVCAFPATSGEPAPISVEDITDLLRMDTSACRELVGKLQTKGLVEVEAGEGAATAETVRITPRGRRLVERMARADSHSD